MNDEDAKIREAIECCRPGSDDLAAPEMAVLAGALGADDELRSVLGRIQDFDECVTQSFRDVPLPEGLEDRLLARLACDEDVRRSERAEPSGMAAIADDAISHERERGASVPEGNRSDAVSRRAPSTRRRFPFAISASVAAALAVVIGVSLYIFGPADPPISREDFLRQATAAITTARQQRAWSPYPATEPADRIFPVEKIVRQPIGWQRVDASPLDDKATAYLIGNKIGSEIILLVIQSPQEVTGLKPDPPRVSFPATGEQSIGAWHSNGHLFVVVVRGADHERRYREILEDPPTLAWTPRKVSPPSLIGKL